MFEEKGELPHLTKSHVMKFPIHVDFKLIFMILSGIFKVSFKGIIQFSQCIQNVKVIQFSLISLSKYVTDIDIEGRVSRQKMAKCNMVGRG